MDDRKIIALKRKQDKQFAHRKRQGSADFILEYCQAILLDELKAVHDASARDQLSEVKTLLLYAQDQHFRAQLVEAGIECDQIPFSALLSSQAHNKLIASMNAYDQLLSNLTIDWVDAGDLISSIQSLLLPQGRVWLTAYGPQTAKRSQSLLSQISQHAHFNAFYEMKDIGDALAGAGFKEVVVESRMINLNYDSVEILLRDVQCVFGLNTHQRRLKGVCPKSLLTEFKRRISRIIDEKTHFCEQVEIITARGRMPSSGVSGLHIPVRVARE